MGFGSSALPKRGLRAGDLESSRRDGPVVRRVLPSPGLACGRRRGRCRSSLVNRSKRVNDEALEWCGVYDQQLKRWLGQRLTPAQRREVVRVQRDQRRVLNELLALLDELAANTIDRQLAKSDTQLGLEYLLGFGPPLPPRHPPT